MTIDSNMNKRRNSLSMLNPVIKKYKIWYEKKNKYMIKKTYPIKVNNIITEINSHI